MLNTKQGKASFQFQLYFGARFWTDDLVEYEHSNVDGEVEAAVQGWAKRGGGGRHAGRNHGLRTLLATLAGMWPAAASDPTFADGEALASCESGQVRKAYVRPAQHPLAGNLPAVGSHSAFIGTFC